MKTNKRFRNTNRYFFLLGISFFLVSFSAYSQLCQNSTDSIYGLNSITGSGSGQIVGINVNNRGTIAIGSPASGSANANGLGFSQLNGLFYFFNWSGASPTAGTTQFVSFNPNTGSKVSLAIPSSPALPTASTGKLRSGTITRDGTGYYTIFPGATSAMGYPITGPAFYYYNIPLNTWTLITQSFKNISGTNVANITTLNSGDMAFDGNNNLWILSSNSTNYALYRIRAPVPTTVQASVTVDTMIAQRAVPTSGVSFTGIAFNSAGDLYLSTGSCSSPPCAAEYNRLYLLTSLVALPTLLTTALPNGYGDDLTSCIYPVGVLPVTWINTNADFQNNAVDLSWRVGENENTSGYDVQSGTDGEHWNTIAHINSSGATTEKTYYYTDHNFQSGSIYYRIVQYDFSGKKSFSQIRRVTTVSDNKIYIGPNPAKDVLYVYNRNNNSKYFAQIFDRDGRQVSSSVLNNGEQTISISQLQRGVFVLRLSSSTPGITPESYRFVKL